MTDPKEVVDFEKFNLGTMKDKVTHNKGWLRLLLGAADPISTKFWGRVTGNRDWEPIVDQWGGAAPDVYGKAEAAGIPSQSGQNMHNIAKGIASIFAGGYGASKLGGFFGGGGEAMGTGAAPGEASGSFTGSALPKKPFIMPQNQAHFDRTGFNAVDSQLQRQLAEYLAKQKMKESEPGWWGIEGQDK